MDTLEKILSPLAMALSNNKYLKAISSGLMSMMVIMMVGAFSSLLVSLPVEGYQEFIRSNGLHGLLQMLVSVTTNMLSLFAAFVISYNFSKSEGKDGLTSGLIALVSFLAITPLETVGEGYAAITKIPLTWLGALGLFTAMIVSLITAKIYGALVDKNITIRLPESVPEFISKSFAGIIPGVIIISIFALVSYLFAMTGYGNMHSAVYALISVPLNNIGGSIWAALIVYLLTGLCWFLGIHGFAILSVVLPIWAAADAANIAAIAAGGNPPNIVTLAWTSVIANIGGAGCTIGLVILCAFFAKSTYYKEFGKMAIVPSLFGINEPVVFGLPCMLNITLAIPFVLLPVLLLGIAYVLTILGILPVGNGIGAPSGTPIVLAGLFTGGWRLAAWQLFATVLSFVVYLPFFKILDKKALASEHDMAIIVE